MVHQRIVVIIVGQMPRDPLDTKDRGFHDSVFRRAYIYFPSQSRAAIDGGMAMLRSLIREIRPYVRPRDRSYGSKVYIYYYTFDTLFGRSRLDASCLPRRQFSWVRVRVSFYLLSLRSRRQAGIFGIMQISFHIASNCDR